MAISSFDDLMHFCTNAKQPRSVCVAGGDDEHITSAVCDAIKFGLISNAYVTGNSNYINSKIRKEFKDVIKIIDHSTPHLCAQHAVEIVRSGRADILMKGHVDSTTFLRAVVDRKLGLRQNQTLSNITVAEMPSYPKLIAATDNGIIPAPDLVQKRQIILNTAPLFRGLGIETVKVAAVAATEKCSDRLPATMDAAILAQESKTGQLQGFEIEGPFGYDVAVSNAAAVTKKIFNSNVAGDADLLLFPTIEAANAVAKSWKFHGQAKTGSLIMGARVPVLLNSRSDTISARLNALMLGLVSCTHKNEVRG